MSLQDGTRMLTTRGVLFDAKDRVNRALSGPDSHTRSSDIDSPVGPPLDIDVVVSAAIPQPPAPHTREQILAAVTAPPLRNLFPPVLPPGAKVSPPAAPPRSFNDATTLQEAPKAAFHRPAFSANDLPAPAGGKVRPIILPRGPPSTRR